MCLFVCMVGMKITVNFSLSSKYLTQMPKYIQIIFIVNIEYVYQLEVLVNKTFSGHYQVYNYSNLTKRSSPCPPSNHCNNYCLQNNGKQTKITYASREKRLHNLALLMPLALP